MSLQTLFFMDANSNSFQVTSPSTTYSPPVIGGNLVNTGDIGNGSITMTSGNEATGGSLDFSMNMGGGGKKKGGKKEAGAMDMPDIPDFMNLMPQWRRNHSKKRLAVLLI